MPTPSKRYPTIEIGDGDIVFRKGDEGECMYLVQEGTVVLLHDEGDDTPAAEFERGDFFGEMAILGDPVRSHAVRAAGPARLVEIDSASFSHLLARNPEMTIRMIRKLSRRIAGTEVRLFRAWSGAPLDADATAARSPRKAWLLPLDTGTVADPISIPFAVEISIGRFDPVNGTAPDIDLTDLDPALSTSRRHAIMRRRGTDLLLEEARSTNGTFVDSHRLEAGQPVALHGGEEVRFGGVRLAVTFEPPQNQPASGAVATDAPASTPDPPQ